MSYFVVERSGDGGGLRIPLPTAYETREEAIAALSAATGSGEVTLSGEVFIADLGSAVPVLVMAVAPPVTPVEVPAEQAVPESLEEEAPADETSDESAEIVAETDEVSIESVEVEPEEAESVEVESEEVEAGDFIVEEAEPAALDEESAEDVYTSWEPIPDTAVSGSALAEALKRATTTLEGEGVVAPESVLGVSDETPVPDEVPSESAEELGEPPADQADEGEATTEWPWANIESYEVPAESVEAASSDPDLPVEVSESAGVAAAEPDISALVESLGEDAPIITSAPPEGEEAYLPHPVILGDYSDVPAEVEAPAEDLAGGADEEPVDLEVAHEAELPGEDDEATADLIEEPGADASAAALDGGYAPMGDLDLGEYTCQDCVYSNTCPKVGQVTPAECGSFQWKSE